MNILNILKEKIRKNIPFCYKILGQTIYAPPGHKTYRYMQKFKNYDVKLAFFSKLVATKYSNSTIVDIGANIGDTLTIIKNGAWRSPVLCIEGNSYFYKYLMINAKNYENIKCLHALVSDVDGDIKVSENRYVGSTNFQINTERGVSIPSMTLAEIFKKAGVTECCLIKSDTDGFDFKILQSSMSIIKKYTPVLFFEYDINWNVEDKENSLILMEGLANIGYSFIIYDNFGNFMQYVHNNIRKIFNDLNIYILQSRKYGGGFYYSDILAIHDKDQDILDRILQSERLL